MVWADKEGLKELTTLLRYEVENFHFMPQTPELPTSLVRPVGLHLRNSDLQRVFALGQCRGNEADTG